MTRGCTRLSRPLGAGYGECGQSGWGLRPGERRLRKGGGMEQYTLDIPGREIARWIQEEKAEKGGEIDFFEGARVEYAIDEDFDRAAWGLHDGEDYDLVSFKAVLDVEPRLERNYWILSVTVEDVLGPRQVTEEEPYAPRELTLEEFISEFLSLAEGTVTVKVWTETPQARKHFDDWLASMRARHGQRRG